MVNMERSRTVEKTTSNAPESRRSDNAARARRKEKQTKTEIAAVKINPSGQALLISSALNLRPSRLPKMLSTMEQGNHPINPKKCCHVNR